MEETKNKKALKREEKLAKKKAGKEKKLSLKMEKLAEDLKPIRNSFVRLFGRIQFKNEGQFLFFGKWMVLLLLFIIETLMIFQNFYLFTTPSTRYKFILLLIFAGGLMASEILLMSNSTTFPFLFTTLYIL